MCVNDLGGSVCDAGDGSRAAVQQDAERSSCKVTTGGRGVFADEISDVSSGCVKLLGCPACRRFSPVQSVFDV